MTAKGIGTVVIGRNEGKRLTLCLDSVSKADNTVIYVDSGSQDGSVKSAHSRGVEVIELDPARPFSAARARNEGFDQLMAASNPEFVQFVDGDCEVQLDWIPNAARFLSENPRAAIACGRLRERFPEVSIYNQLCDWEWDLPVGRLERGCGGIFMVRAEAFSAVDGFRIDLIAGEEPELCIRLRAAGWEIWRLDAEMALHDAAMTRFGQWWKRCRRGGHAYAQRKAMHGAGSERQGVREVRHALVWGVTLPLLILLLTVSFHPAFLLLSLIYAAQLIRMAMRLGPRQYRSWMQAFFVVLSKFPEAYGALEFSWRRWSRKPSRLIEYK